MKPKTAKLLALFTALLLFSNCTKDKCNGSTYNKNVDESYLPDIIPYSDTSTALFLKNGKDTLLFKSQGLKEETVKDYSGEGTCDTYNLQQFSLKMAASDTDYFEIKYYNTRKMGPQVSLKTLNYWTSDEVTFNTFRYFYPPVIKVSVLNNLYDTVRVIKTNTSDSICMKPRYGYLKIKTDKVTYELIK